MIQRLILIFIALAVIAQLYVVGFHTGLKANTPTVIPTITPTPTPLFVSDRKLWSLIQEWRQSEGRQPYIEDQRLCAIADDRVDDGSDNHKGLYSKYSTYTYVIQENSGFGRKENDLLQAWLASGKGHAETLRKPYKASCVSCKNLYCVQIFSNLDY